YRIFTGYFNLPAAGFVLTKTAGHGYNQNFIIIDGFVKSPISALRAITQNFTYYKYAAFFVIAQALILNFLQSRLITTFYEYIIIVQNKISAVSEEVIFFRTRPPKGANGAHKNHFLRVHFYRPNRT
ncbi:MAG: hypothetical protein R6U29_02825, partial [Desulfosudaceae bacterium]